MTAAFTSCGREILRDGQHFGHMMTAEDAAAVAAMFNRRAAPRFTAPEPIEGETFQQHHSRVVAEAERWLNSLIEKWGAA